MKKTNHANVREVRTLQATELRAVSEADGKTYLEGYAARYNVRSSDLGWGMYEILMPGAFTRALNEAQDVRHLVNHDPSALLGRTKSGTTLLSEDEQGLKFRTQLPDTQLGRDLAVSIGRGDINECSFGFICRKATWVEETDDQGKTIDIRQVQDVDLFDVSTVTFPAYPETNTHLAMRAMFPDGLPTEIHNKQGVREAEARLRLNPNDSAALRRLRGTSSALARMDSGENVDGNGDPNTDGDGCMCACPYCEQDRCEYCCNEYCREEDCLHGYPANHNALDLRADKTKRVDGEDLPSSAFLIVGDKDDPSTWKLPVHFSTDEKSKSHIKNALARFGQMKDVSDEQKSVAWTKLLKLAEENGITVSDEDKKKHSSAEPAADNAIMDAQIALTLVEAKLRAIRSSLD